MLPSSLSIAWVGLSSTNIIYLDCDVVQNVMHGVEERKKWGKKWKNGAILKRKENEKAYVRL